MLWEVGQEGRELGGTALAALTDVTREEDVQRVAAAAIERFGRIDVWVDDAGESLWGAFQGIPMRT